MQMNTLSVNCTLQNSDSIMTIRIIGVFIGRDFLADNYTEIETMNWKDEADQTAVSYNGNTDIVLACICNCRMMIV